MMPYVAVVFWLSLGVVVYAYLGYAAAIWLCSRIFGRPVVAPTTESVHLPQATILIAALNEEKVIASRLENALQQDYPVGRLEIIIASDGSNDRTNPIVNAYEERFPGQVRLLPFPVRRGKATVLNEAITAVKGEIVILSDANTFFEPSAVRNLVRWFGDPTTIAACGKLVLLDHESGRNVDSLYWRYETFLKSCEARLGALLGSNGAIYAIRRSQYQPIPVDTIIDDFVIPLTIKHRTRGRIVYDQDAIAFEETPPYLGDEFRRRCRIGAGGFQSLFRLWKLALPANGWTSLAFCSHKVLRWFCPFFLLTALLTNALLLGQHLYEVLFWLQITFYALAVIGMWLPGSHFLARAVRLSTLFVSMNAALAVGFWRWISGVQRGTWQRTSR